MCCCLTPLLCQKKKINFKLKFISLIPTKKHHHLQQENESLKVENSNLTTVAKLMTESMKESVDTGKR